MTTTTTQAKAVSASANSVAKAPTKKTRKTPESISYQKFTKAIVGSPFLNYNTLVRKDQGKNCRNYGRGSRKSQVSLTRKKYTLMLS